MRGAAAYLRIRDIALRRRKAQDEGRITAEYRVWPREWECR